MDRVLAKSVAKPHIQVFEDMFAEQLANVDLSVVLMDMIDTCPAEALPYLAHQFDVEGYKGMRWADTIQKQRDLIKRSIELHRYKGTRWAISESLKVLGYNDVVVEDHLKGNIYDGTYDFNGTIYYSSPHWAMFRVIINISDTFTWTSNLYPDIAILVNEYKNVRSHLLDISAGISIQDNVNISESFRIPEFGLVLADSFANLQYNGAATYGGSNIYQGETDTLTITIT
jgi:phage tail P2-like protein